MGYKERCWKLRRVGLWVAASLLGACTMGGSEPVVGVCPPVVTYSAGFQARAAKEVQALSEGAAVVEMLSDYAVLRAQVRVCRI